MTEKVDPRYKLLKDYRFPAILMGVSRAGKTGTLYLKNWPVEKILFIRNGKIIFASSNVEDDCLGISLLSWGKISVVQYYESIRVLEKTGKRHGLILMELGYLSQKDLEDAVKRQVEKIALSIFKWEYGYFLFEEAPFSIEESITLDTDMTSLIYKGIKNMDSFPQIRNALPLTTVLAPSDNSSKLLHKLKIGDAEKKIIGMVDGSRTVIDILRHASGDDLETLKVLYAINSMGAAVALGYTGIGEEAILNEISSSGGPDAMYKKGTEFFMSGKYNESVTAFREAANLSPEKAPYHFYLAMSLVNTFNLEEAEGSLLRAIEIEPFNDDYYTELGIIYARQGLAEKASRAFEFALRINPHNERARTSLSEIKKDKKSYNIL